MFFWRHFLLKWSGRQDLRWKANKGKDGAGCLRSAPLEVESVRIPVLYRPLVMSKMCVAGCPVRPF